MESTTRASETAAQPGWGSALRTGLGRLSRRMTPPRTPRVGEVLLKEDVVTAAQLERALDLQLQLDQPIGQTIVELGLAEESEVLAAINKHFHIGAESLSDNVAALIRSRAASRRSLTRLRRVLRMRLSLVLVAVIWFTIFGLSLVTLGRHRAQLTDSAVELGAVSINYLAENAKLPLLEGDMPRLNGVLKAIVQAEGVVSGLVADSQGVVRAHTDPKAIGDRLRQDPTAAGQRRDGDVTFALARNAEGVQVLHLRKPVSFQGKELGQVRLSLSLERIGTQVLQETLIIGFLSLLILAFGIVLAIQQGSSLLRPLTAWLATTRHGGDEREFHVRVRARHEFEDLAASFDAISRELTQKLMLERSLGQYVNPTVLERIRAHPEEPWLNGQRSDATVLFTDVRGFTGIVEAREPEAVVEALNEYFAICTRAIVAQGGYVDKYIGDAVLGVFGLPASHDDHALRAVKAAVYMQKELKRRSRNNLNPFLNRVGVGLNSGVVVSGNIGSEDKMEYTVIGDCVNVASRLTALAQPGEIICSDAVAEQIPRHLITVKQLEARPLKGKKALVVAYKVLKTEF